MKNFVLSFLEYLFLICLGSFIVYDMRANGENNLGAYLFAFIIILVGCLGLSYTIKEFWKTYTK